MHIKLKTSVLNFMNITCLTFKHVVNTMILVMMMTMHHWSPKTGKDVISINITLHNKKFICMPSNKQITSPFM